MRSKRPAKKTARSAKSKASLAKDSDKAPHESSFPVVGIGASAGGLSAVTELLKALPGKIGLAVVVIQHLDPKHGSLTPEILARSSRMPVAEVKEGMRIEPDHVYVIPPNKNLELSKSALKLSPRIEARGQHLPIDYFFQSIALERENQAIGVVLSGIASDGTMGLRAIKDEGGLTFAQDPKTAQYDGMPRSAILSGAVDIIESPKGIAAELVRISQTFHRTGLGVAKEKREFGPESQLSRIFGILRKATGVDFAQYKQSTIQRRIARRLFVLKMADLRTYAAYLADHSQEVKTLFEEILIQVTSFFRDPNAFEFFKSHILPKYMKSWHGNAPFRIWVPGCSSGEEVYSIAIIFFEFLDRAPVHPQLQIFASDISEQAIQKARTAVYPDSITKDVSRGRLRRFFEKVEGGYRIAKFVRDTCLFSRQDVTADPPFAKIDLISCRNVLIYFTAELQKRVIPVFHYALNPGGILWLGRSETITQFSNIFTLEDRANKFYTKRQLTTPVKLELPVSRYAGEAWAGRQELPDTVVTTLQEVQREADRISIQEYAPPSVVINDANEILHVRGRPAPYLELTPGQASLSLFKLARPEIVADLRYLIGAARRQQGPARKDGLILADEGGRRNFGIKVVPLRLSSKERCFLVFFEESSDSSEVPSSGGRGKKVKAKKSIAADRRQQMTQQRFAEVQKYQQALIEEYEATQEELTSSNEELQSTNEELQSTNEELETAKEELQSANEEMTTVNDELQNRNAEMTQLTNDLTNLISSVDIPIVMVGQDARIRSFTPKAAQVLRLIAGDIGRPIGDIKPGVQDVELDEFVSSVMSSMAVKEVETQDKRGSWYRLQVRPYRTVENKIDGAVIVLIDITLQKNSAQLLTGARDDARMIIESMPMPMLVITADRRVQLANKAFYETFHTDLQETEGRFLSELGDGQWNIPSLLTMLEGVLNQNSHFENFEIELDFPEVGHKCLVLHARRTYLAGAGTQAALLALEDHTTLKRIAHELQSAEERYRNLLEHAHDGIIVVNRNGNIEFANRRVESLFGYTPGELNHKPYSTLIPEEMREAHRAAHDAFMRQPEPRDMDREVDIYGLRKDGVIVPLDISLSPVKMNGEVMVTAVIRDISARKKLEEERLHILEVEREARHEAEKAIRIKDEFLATLSHELRSPLATVLTWTQILRLGKGDPNKGLSLIEKSAKDQSQLIEDLLDVSRIQAGKLHLELSVVDPLESVTAAVDSIRSLAEEKSLSIDMELDPSGAKVKADPIRLEQVFRNLLNNAVKFTPSGGRITVQSKRSGKPGSESIQIRVSDTGRGIKAEFLPMLFTRFTQAETTTTRAYGGLGLGLSIVRHLVEMHGGTVIAESTGEEKGAVFTVELPCAKVDLMPDTVPGPEKSQEQMPQTPAKLDGLRVLIVDDMKDTRNAFQEILQSLGADVRTAVSAREGFDVFSEYKPDVLLCDLAMPEEDGYSLIRKIRTLRPDQGGKTPAAALTALADTETTRRTLDAQFDRHIPKPVDVVTLSNVIAKLAGK